MSQSDRIKDVFAEIIDMAPAERAAAIDRLCDGDLNLHARVLALLSAHDAAGGGGFMAEPTAHPDAPTPHGEAGAEVGQTLGAFTLEKVIGEGGFGTVFLGRQEAPIQRCAAIKILKPGMDSRQVIARFEAERQTLAMMDHEGIAKIIDAGATESGRPFVVMEYVEGWYITDYCDHRRLSIEERLRLFERICLAVQHAHQKGVIHRDLKPSNILVAEVDGRPMPKIIDFGIAKALEAGHPGGAGDSAESTEGAARASRLTGGHQLLGTPEYMSPEQASGGELDTRTDVYSLGVLLYELLCGAAPFDRHLLRKAGPAQLERILREDRPARPSTRIGPGRNDLPQVAAARRSDPPRLRRQLRGDLDWIVMRALEKDPERRYPTAYALSADIRRALDSQPVEAGPPSFVYVGGKLLKRHRGAAAGIIIAGLLILSALAVATIGFYRAHAASLEAEAEKAAANRQLKLALVAQARATRRSDTPGRRATSLQAIAKAAEYGATAELRSEAIAALGLTDLRLTQEILEPRQPTALGLDRVDRIATAEEGFVRIKRLADGQSIAELPAPPGDTSLARFTPDGRHFAAWFTDGGGRSLRVWDVESGEATIAIDGDFDAAAVAFGGDLSGSPWVAVGRLAAAGEAGGAGESAREGEPGEPGEEEVEGVEGAASRIEIYSLPQGELLGAFEAPAGWKRLAGARHGRLLAVNIYGELSVDIRSVPGGELLGRHEAPAPIFTLELNDGGDVLAAGCADFSLAFWATERFGPPAHLLRGHQGQPVALEFGSGQEGTVLLASAGWDNTVRLWDLSRLEPVIGPVENAFLVGFGENLVTRKPGSVGVWERRTGAEVRALVVPGHLGVKAQVAIGPHTPPRYIATGGAEGARLWNIEGRPLARLTTEDTIGVEFLPDGRMLTLHDDALRMWRIVESGGDGGGGGGVSVESAGVLHQASVDGRMALLADGRLALAGPREFSIIDLETGEVSRPLPPYPGLAATPAISGRWAFTGAWKGDGRGRVRDLETGETVLEVKAEHVVGAFSPTPTGEPPLLVVGTGAWFACYEVSAGMRVAKSEKRTSDGGAGEESGAGSGDAPESEDSREDALGNSLGNTWGRQLWRVERDNTDPVAGVLAFSPDGTLLALGRSRFALDLVEPRTGRLIATIDSPDRRALGEVAISADGKWIVAATTSDLLQIINLGRIRDELRERGLDWERPGEVER